MSVVLEARGVGVSIGRTAIVAEVDLVAREGHITVIVGTNGAGKTTLLDCLSGVTTPDRGVVRHRGQDVTGWSADALARRGVVRTFQRSSLFPTLTVEQNLMVGAENRRRTGIARGVVALPDPGRRRATATVDRVLDELGLRTLASARVAVLPTGTLRLVELARALCAEPDVLLLDEPASGLDDTETAELHRVLRSVALAQLAIVMVEHDLALVHAAADDVLVMAGGRVVASGSAEDVLARDAVRARLGGELA